MVAVHPVEGFLPVTDYTEGVQVLESSLAYQDLSGEGGALNLKSSGPHPNPQLTRYFIQPMARGKVYASMLVKYEGRHQESVGEINWLVQNGWNGPTEKQASLSFQQDGIYLDKADPVPPYTKQWLSEHHRKVVRVLFEFELGTIGQDVLRVYIDPPGSQELPAPDAIMKGEFTFDRLQFKLTARPPSNMGVDEVRISRKLADVLP